jgi:hypothetical protein
MCRKKNNLDESGNAIKIIISKISKFDGSTLKGKRKKKII